MSQRKTFTRGVGVETDYREESTQTQPYTIVTDEQTEVFTRPDFAAGKGRPASSIERLRARRTKIGIEREEEIQRLQSVRHKLFTKDLHTSVDLGELTAYRAGKQLAIQQQRLQIDASRDRRRLERIFRLRTRRINASSRVTERIASTVKLPLRLRDLHRAQQFIDEEKSKSNIRRPCRFLERIESSESKEISQLPSRWSSEIDEERRRRIDLIELQIYLRGIVVQSRLDHVRRIRGDLLDELRREATNDDDERTLISPPIADLDWSTVAEMLDFLSKELIRLQCEQSIGLFISQADGHRLERERNETTRRRSTTELAFPLPELDGFLVDLIRQSIFDTADEQARETSVSELVHHFLIPLVHRLLRRPPTTQ